MLRDLIDVVSFIAGTVGALLTPQFVQEAGWLGRLYMIVTGAVMATLLTRPIMGMTGIPVTDDMKAGVGFLVGMFGWVLVEASIRTIRHNDVLRLAAAVATRIFGRRR